jgi:protein-disulfide isomerase
MALAASGGALAITTPRPAWSQAEPPSRGERAIGSTDAKVTVVEFFSLTCGHCAAFARTTLPQVKEKLVATGKMRLVYHDYPLDQVALTAAMVARHLPPERYEPFVLALLATQDRWAFNRAANPTEELWKMAALAGMSRSSFDAAIADTGLRDWIIRQAQSAQEKWRIDATPSFVVNGQRYSGDMSFESFRKLVPE